MKHRPHTGSPSPPPRAPVLHRDDDTLLGAILRRCAEEEGGLRALARMLDVSPQSLYDVMGGRVPGKYLGRVVAGYLGVTPDQIAAWATETST